MVSPELLAACRRGDPRAFEEVVRATHRQVYTQALRLVRDRQDAEDVAQEAYLRVFRGLAGFRGDAQFETWLYRIVANAAMNHLRRRGRFGDLLADPEDDRLEPPERPSAGPADVAVDREALNRELEALPDSMRAVVVAKDVYGLSCLEIGDMVGATEGAVKVRLHRARKRLKERLFEGEGGEGDEV
jgi:RNA polymerase sigma-70 factor (ECF subfamily)